MREYGRGSGTRVWAFAHVMKGARIGDEQMEWLGKCLAKAGKLPVVLLMNRPIWKAAPQFWYDRLLKELKKGNVAVAIFIAAIFIAIALIIGGSLN